MSNDELADRRREDAERRQLPRCPHCSHLLAAHARLPGRRGMCLEVGCLCRGPGDVATEACDLQHRAARALGSLAETVRGCVEGAEGVLPEARELEQWSAPPGARRCEEQRPSSHTLAWPVKCHAT